MQRYVKVVFLLIYVCCVVHVHATVVVNTNITLTEVSDFPYANFVMTVYQDATATNPTSIWFYYDQTSLTFVSQNIDEGSSWYFASYEDEFSATAIDNDDFERFSYIHPISPGDFYLGVNTADGAEYDIFGWVKLRNSPSGLELLDSAVAYHYDGIIIGTTTIIPEPAALALFTLGGLLLRKRK